ncbi:UNVERIFIED_CONTAM: Phosphatidylinositol 4-kinase gamma 8 [Sesamum radiatum]|uniref:1-phosphatidylinositol 4-kinase n=1 Tax=Sesamum radiatum TaxID=300843 RepID=A0AAW2NQN2_SESRA
MNLDRHAGNILVRKQNESYGRGDAELVPIDHGYCLPESLDDPYFEWLHWPQASVPFSEPAVDYVSRLDPYKDAELLRTELPSIRESSIRVLVICTIFLKQATAYGLSLADMGEIMTREINGGEENWSALENLCIIAKARLNNGLGDDNVIKSDHDEEYIDVSHEDRLNQESNAHRVFHNSPAKVLSDECDTYTNVDKFHLMGMANDNAGCLISPVANYSHDGEGISFGDMDNDEWHSFLTIFEKLLSKAFEERTSMALSNQRFGSSCEF